MEPSPTQGAGRLDSDGCSAWNPGLEDEIPEAFKTLETIYRPEHVSSGMADVLELSRQTGLAVEKLVVFRAERLVLHELIIRVTAGVEVREGEQEEDLGRHFREIVRAILQAYVAPRMDQLVAAHAALHDRVRQRVVAELEQVLREPEPAAPVAAPSLLQRLFGRRAAPKTAAPQESRQERELRAVAGLQTRTAAGADALESAIRKSAYRILSALLARRGHLGADRDLLVALITDHVCNRYGSRQLGEMIQPDIDRAVSELGLTPISNARAPILISLKGASAAGKSSLRPLLNRVITEQGLDAQHYATISPDIWRRLLLDYEGLGPARKYAGRLTSKEVMVIDSKLDRYMRDRARASGSIPHLLVDRFRFDSFASEKVSRILHDTYARYVDTLYMYFVITPPEATVERGWERGLKVGRYKSVEDFLDHSVEACSGMPRILFKWLAHDRPRFRFEFLDNSVAKGSPPLCIARGTQEWMEVFDPIALIDIERYQKINIKARRPDAVYPDASQLRVERNAGFLRQCLQRIPSVRFIDRDTGTAYLATEKGQPHLLDAATLRRLCARAEMAAVLRLVAPAAVAEAEAQTGAQA